MVDNNKFIGKTSSTNQIPSTVDDFYFWLLEGEEIQPYDFVTAKENIKDGQFIVVGIVKGISNYTDAVSHLSNRIISDTSEINEEMLKRISITIARVEVLYSYVIKNNQIIERRYPISSNIPVYISTKDEILTALTANYKSKHNIPGGIISRTTGEPVVVPLAVEYLMGPEGGHLNVSGITGLATKTSYMMFLLYNVNRSNENKYINIIFNVKGTDLLNIDKPANDLNEDDKNLWHLILGEDNPEPFKNVKYYFPRGEGGKPYTYSKKNENEYLIYAFSLADIYEDLDLLFSDVIDEYHTVESFSRYIKRDWKKADGRLDIPSKRYHLYAENWTELKKILENNMDALASTYNLRQDTLGRIKRELDRLTNFPIFVDKRSNTEKFIREVIRNANSGETIVIDIAKLELNLQTFIIGEVFRELENIIRTETEIKKKAIIVVDELNSIAPRDIDTPLKWQVKEVARKGRDAGFIIFGAEQFASEVDDQIIGNSSLRAIGRTSSMEISTNAYRNLSPEDKSTAMVLRKGEMLISFPGFNSRIKIKFPKPPILRS